MKATRVFAVTLLALAAIGAVGWFGWAQFGSTGTEGAERQLTYKNVSITLPSEDSKLFARADYAPPESVEKPGGGPVIVVTDESEARSGYMVIDANTGEVLVDTIGGALRDEANALVSSVKQEKAPAGVWPLADVAPPGPRVAFGNISYIEPDPSSGIFVIPAEGDGDGGSGVGLFIHNGESRMLVSGSTGKIDMSLVKPADAEAFDRLAAAIRLDLRT